jgi:hypothetical protein
VRKFQGGAIWARENGGAKHVGGRQANLYIQNVRSSDEKITINEKRGKAVRGSLYND